MSMILTQSPAIAPIQSTHDARVSVILPTFNRAHLIAESIDSLLAQSVPPIEIVVIDDGSTDGTGDVVKRFDAPVTYIRKENGGKLSGINLGLKQITGDYVLIMDDDDLLPVDAIENLMTPFVRNPELGLTYGSLQKFQVNPETGAHEDVYTSPYPDEDGRSFFVRVMEDCYITGQPCIMVRKDCYDAISPLRTEITISEDYDVLLSLAHLYQAERVHAVTLLQRQHDGDRGPAEIRYAAEMRFTKWCEMDTVLLTDLLPKVTLGELLGRSADESPQTPEEFQRAYFQRATIAARKKLWDMAIDAMRDAAAAGAKSGLEPIDRVILSKAMGCRYGLDELIEDPTILDDFRRTMKGLSCESEAVRAIAGTLLYAARVRLIEKDYANARGFWRLYWRFAGAGNGVRGVIGYVGRSAMKLIGVTVPV